MSKTMSGREKEMREQLCRVLEGSWAHVSLEAALEGFPPELRNREAASVPHTAWHLVYHLHAAQRDILDFIRSPDYREREYPAGYWPRLQPACSDEDWAVTIASIRSDLNAIRGILLDPAADLHAPLPNGTGQTLFREALVLGNHNSYHIGQLVDLRMLLGVPVRDW